MGHWASKQIEKDTLREYQKKNNAYSLDGLPGLRAAVRDAGRSVWWAKMIAWMGRIAAQREALGIGMLVGCLGLLVAQALANYEGMK